MKILDKYIARNFIVGYVIVLIVLMGLCIVIDLFINLDEFAELSDLGARKVLSNMAMYYGAQLRFTSDIWPVSLPSSPPCFRWAG